MKIRHMRCRKRGRITLRFKLQNAIWRAQKHKQKPRLSWRSYKRLLLSFCFGLALNSTAECKPVETPRLFDSASAVNYKPFNERSQTHTWLWSTTRRNPLFYSEIFPCWYSIINTMIQIHLLNNSESAISNRELSPRTWLTFHLWKGIHHIT